jgi:ankyrin repeat protein
MKKSLLLLFFLNTVQNIWCNSATLDIQEQIDKNIIIVQEPTNSDTEYETPLHKAAAENDIQTIQLIIFQQPTAIYTKDSNGRTPLFLLKTDKAIGYFIYIPDGIESCKDYIENCDNTNRTALDHMQARARETKNLAELNGLKKGIIRLKNLGATEQCKELGYHLQACNMIGILQTPCRDGQGTIWYKTKKTV